MGISERIDIKFSKRDLEKGLKLPSKMTDDLAYLCGVFAGDGHISFDKKKYRYCIKCVGNPKDEKEFYHQIIAPAFEKVFGISVNVKDHDSGITYGFEFFSKALIKYLVDVIGLPSGRKYPGLCIPKVFLSDDELVKSFLRGVYDTDGGLCFKRRYREKPYYPVLNFSSRNKCFIWEISMILKSYGFTFYETYDYRVIDPRLKQGFNLISRIELNGKENFRQWEKIIGFRHPKHLEKISLFWKS